MGWEFREIMTHGYRVGFIWRKAFSDASDFRLEVDLDSVVSE